MHCLRGSRAPAKWMDPSPRSRSLGERLRGLTMTSGRSDLLAACRGNDSIHPQIFHHLAVMIEAVPGQCRGHSQTSRRAIAERALDSGHQILLVNTSRGFVSVSEGILQEFHNIGLALDGIGSDLTTGINRRLLAENRAADHVVHDCHMLHLLRK